MSITKVIKQLVDPNDSSTYIFPVTGIYSTYDSSGTPLDELLDDKMDSPSSAGTNGQVLTTNGSGSYSWSTVYDLTMNHRALTGSSGAFTFANESDREYVTVESSATATTITLNINNTNEHYIIVCNTNASDTITVGLVGSNSESIIGSGSIDIESGNFCEIGVLKHTINSVDYYIITERELESE